MTPDLNEPAERDEFEAWAFTKSWRNFTRDEETGEYVVADSHLERLWRGWLARARIAAEREAELVKALREIMEHDWRAGDNGRRYGPCAEIARAALTPEKGR